MRTLTPSMFLTKMIQAIPMAAPGKLFCFEEPKMTTWEQEQKLLAAWEERQSQSENLPVAQPLVPRVLNDGGIPKIDDFVGAQQMTDTNSMMYWNRKPKPFTGEAHTAFITAQQRFDTLCAEILADIETVKKAPTTEATQKFLNRWGFDKSKASVAATSDEDSPIDIQLQSEPVVRAQTKEEEEKVAKLMKDVQEKLRASANQPLFQPASGSAGPFVPVKYTINLDNGIRFDPEVITEAVPAPARAPEPRCDCGGAKAKTTHSDWCSVSDQSVLNRLLTDRK